MKILLCLVLICSAAFADITNEDVYRLATEKIKRLLVAPRTAIFSEFSKDPEVAVKAMGRGVYEVEGFVDAQNSFSALLRNEWRVDFHYDGNTMDKVFYVRLGEQIIGNLGDGERAARGQPTLDQLPKPVVSTVHPEEMFLKTPPPEYDYLAKERHYEGRGSAKIVVENGRILDVEITSSTGVSYLDTSTVRWIKGNWKVKDGASGSATLPIIWKLPSR